MADEGRSGAGAISILAAFDGWLFTSKALIINRSRPCWCWDHVLQCGWSVLILGQRCPSLAPILGWLGGMVPVVGCGWLMGRGGFGS